jgi:hypothetical protein
MEARMGLWGNLAFSLDGSKMTHACKTCTNLHFKQGCSEINEQLHQPQSSTEFLKQNMGMGRFSFEHGVVFVYGEFLFLSSR